MASRLPENLTKNLFEFLNNDLDLATTFVQVAKTELSMDDREHAARALAKARRALQTVRHFLVKPGLSAEQVALLTDRCYVLESAIERVFADV